MKKSRLPQKMLARRHSVLDDESTRKANLDRWFFEELEFVFRLFKEYGIPPGPLEARLFHLVIALSGTHQDHRPAKPVGRRKRWTPWLRAVLVVSVDRLRQKKSATYSVKSACNALSKQEPWAHFLKRGGGGVDPAEALRVQYFESKDDEFVALMAKTAPRSESAWNEVVVRAVNESNSD